MIPVLFLVLFIFVFLYGMLLLPAALKWFGAKSATADEKIPGSVYISIIVPARNEEKKISSCLNSIAQQHFPVGQFEIIVADDCSADATSAEVSNFIAANPQLNITLLRLTENPHGKKGALLAAVQKARGEIIITRDADSVSPSQQWLKTIAAFYAGGKPHMIICPVTVKNGGGFLSAFELTENYFLQATGAGLALAGLPVMCNGANLAFSRAAFRDVNGYQDNLHVKSGDDIFLMEKFRKQGYTIAYLKSKDALVHVPPVNKFSDMLQQKLRWAGKFRLFANPLNTLLGLLVFGVNLLFVISAAWSLIFGVWYKYLILCVLLKWIIDFLLLILASSEYKVYKWVPWFIFLELFNFAYSALLPIAAFFISPTWKGRKI